MVEQGSSADIPKPIVVDLGRTSRKAIKRLKRGRGKLMREVEAAITQVSANLEAEAQSKQIIPVVFLYRRRERKRRPMFFPFMS